MGIEDPELLVIKVKGRELAETILQMAAEEMPSMLTADGRATERTSLLGLVFRQEFWQHLRARVDVVLGPVPPPPPVVAPPPVMPTELLATFENERLPFGGHVGRRICDVKSDPELLHYLAWLSDQQFIDRLRAYLRHPAVQQRLRDLPPRKFRPPENL